MMAKQLPDIEYLKSILDYCKESGEFTWKVAKSRRIRVGEVAGTKNSKGYIMINIDGSLYSAHRLAIHLIGVGEFDQVDHINRIKTDNRIVNLRTATNQLNSFNQKKRSTNTTGVVGVDRHQGGYRARLMVDGVNHFLGHFNTLAEASYAREKAFNKLVKPLFDA